MLPNCERNKTEEEHDEFDKLFGDLYSEDDPFRLNEPIITNLFKCICCGMEDEVPDFVVEEFCFDL